MADITTIAIIAALGIFAVLAVAILGYLLIKYVEHAKKNTDYVEKNYLDLVKFTMENCTESIHGFNLERATSTDADGTVLGKIVGHAVLSVDKKEKVGNDVIKEQITRHFITYRPARQEFNILQPSTWKPNYRIAIIQRKEIPHGLNGNVRWIAASIDWYKFYVFSMEDPVATKEKIANKIGEDVELDLGLHSWTKVGALVDKATEAEPTLSKSIKIESEHRPRR